uniref:Solute-binding protein family 5 domain-containing protein n=1 Tax=Octactis speculum TaxID=3111310 RepID=A0A7S2CRM7_9STRA
MNPHAYRPNEFVSNAIMFEGLTAWDPTSAGADGISGTSDDFVVGALAESWTTNIDDVLEDSAVAYTITFNLREGVTFHDGEDWDAAAAVLNFNHILGKADGDTVKSWGGFHDWYGLGFAIESWEAVSTYEFEVTFSNYYEAALRELSFIRPFRMSSPNALPSMADGEISCEAFRNGAPRTTFDGLYTCTGVTAPIGTGPYQVVEKLIKSTSDDSVSKTIPAADFRDYCYDSDSAPGCEYDTDEYVAEVRFEKVSGHRLNPTYDNVVLKSHESQVDIRDNLLDGTIDMAYGLRSLSPSSFITLATDEADQLVAHQDTSNLNTRLIVLNSDGALDTKAKRQLIFGIIDRDPLLEGELAEEDPSETHFDQAYPYCNISDLLSVAQVAALSTASVDDIAGPLRFMYLKDVSHQSIIASKVIADLYTAGIGVTPIPLEKDDFNAAMNYWLDGNSSWDIAYGETWGPSYDATTKLYDMTYEWGSGEPDTAATLNMEGMNKTDFYKLIRSLSAITDADARQNAYTEVLTLLNEEAIFLPLTHKRNIAVVGTGVSGFEFGSTEFDIPVAQLYPASSDDGDDDDDGSLSDGAIAGIVIGAILLVFFLMATIFLVVREKQGKPMFYSPLDTVVPGNNL